MVESNRKSQVVANNNQIKKLSNKSIIFGTVIIILYNLLILGYIITLEGNDCNCIRDWRHDFIKYYTMCVIVYSVVVIILTGTSLRNNFLILLFQTVLFFMMFVNVWCLFTYIEELDKTYCKCATEKQKTLHYFLYIWRYILVIGLIITLIAAIVGMLNYSK